jgi:aspartyl-tRNA(Asn)/glutamyl-tRNA(Gln) amidotransferase subunit C
VRLTKNEVEHVAWLARLELSEQEKDRLTGHLNQIMEHFEALQQLDTADVEPTSHSIPMSNVFREDKAGPSFTQDEAVSNAPDSRDFYFVVPQVVET